MLVAEAARASGLPERLAMDLEAQWNTLLPWDEALRVLATLRKDFKLGVVTNCSERLGRAAAARVGVPFDVIVSAERAGFYKPDPAPYRLALSELSLEPREVSCSWRAQGSTSPVRRASASIPIGTTALPCNCRRGPARRSWNRARWSPWANT
jgi:HAD superfamily hydrolase (TIGR01493 family)